MATTVAGSAMAGGGGFVLKSVRKTYLDKDNDKTFSVQNEGDFCVITNDDGYNYKFVINKIDDVPVEISMYATSLIFGKNIVVRGTGSGFNSHIFEYGPAE